MLRHTHRVHSNSRNSTGSRLAAIVMRRPQSSSSSILPTTTTVTTTRSTLQQQSRRTLFSSSENSGKDRVKLSFFETAKLQAEIQSLERQIESQGGSKDLRLILQYLRALGRLRPKDAVAYIERGWQSQALPLTEEFLKEYIKAASSLNKLDGLNVSGLLALANKAAAQQGAVAAEGGAAAGTLDIATLLRPSVVGVGSLGGGSGRMIAGSSPMEPLYIAAASGGAGGSASGGWKTEAWKVARYGLGMFLLLSLLGTFIDDRLGGVGGSGGSGGAGGIASRMGIGSAVHQAENPDKTFNDVVGVDEAKHDLQEIVMYLKDPKRFTRLGGRLPKGVLLTGPPGTGKTLLARAIAGEAKVPFFHASGSEFEEMYVGVGAKRVRELFDVAKQKAPCIIFIDEIDAIGGSRQVKDQSAMKMTLNQLLVEMDGFEQNNGVIVIAATNFPDSLDSALVRPGRFDKHVDVPMPDIGGRKAILGYYGKKIPMDSDVDLEQLARGTPGFSGAELFNLMNQAALKASVDGLKAVPMAALEFAKDKIMMGAERKSAIISPETMKCTAFHEAGHALVAIKTDGADPIHKATIMPRGRALGMVMQLPDGDQTSMSKKQMLARLDVCMGGRVAEELVFGAENVTSGASSDIQQATRLARAMVTKYGLSEKIGIQFIDDSVGGKSGGPSPSGVLQQEVDAEVKEILQASYQRAKALLTKHRKELDNLAQGLLDYESLSGSEVVEVLSTGKLANVVPNGVMSPAAQAKRSQRPSRPMQAIAALSAANDNGNNGASGTPSPAAAPPATPTPAPTPAPTANSKIAPVPPVTQKAPTTTTTTVAVSATTSTADKLLPPSPTADASSNSSAAATAAASKTVTSSRGPPKA